MRYLGTVKNGVVVFADNFRPADGTLVEVNALDPSDAPVTSTGQPAAGWDLLLSLAGRIDHLSQVSSVNLEHYLYDLPKRT